MAPLDSKPARRTLSWRLRSFDVRLRCGSLDVPSTAFAKSRGPRYKQRMELLSVPSAEQDALPPPAESPFKPRVSAGFTLVEIAVVLVIIGLIVGGIMVGADLIKAATIRAQVSQISKYDSAILAFRAKYNVLPGDLPATDSQGLGLGLNCRGSPINYGVGNGNGFLDSSSHLSPAEEEFFVIPHLTIAGLVADGAVCGDVAYGTYNMGEIFPRGKIAGGAGVIPWTVNGKAVWFVGGMKSYAGGSPWLDNFYSGAVMSPTTAQALDAKVDDGNPLSGSVQAAVISSSNVLQDTNAGSCFTTTTANAYNTSNVGLKCNLMFNMQSW